MVTLNGSFHTCGIYLKYFFLIETINGIESISIDTLTWRIIWIGHYSSYDRKWEFNNIFVHYIQHFDWIGWKKICILFVFWELLLMEILVEKRFELKIGIHFSSVLTNWYSTRIAKNFERILRNQYIIGLFENSVTADMNWLFYLDWLFLGHQFIYNFEETGSLCILFEINNEYQWFVIPRFDRMTKCLSYLKSENNFFRHKQTFKKKNDQI